jgi:hypothetical protein
MTSRRAFLLGSIGLLAAPAIVRAESLMKIVVPKPRVLSLHEWVEIFRYEQAAELAKIYEDSILFGSAAWQETSTGLRYVPIEDWRA